MRLRLIALLALAGASGCTDASSFSCLDDTACVLGGEPGICTEVGQCAYPSAECPTGWEYPPAAPGGLGDTCAPGPVDTQGGDAGSSSASGASQGSGSSDGDSGTSGGGSASDGTGTTSPVTDSSTTAPSTSSSGTGSETDGSTGGAGTGSACGPDEGDDIDQAEDRSETCDFTITGDFHGAQDFDWFRVTIPASCGADGYRIQPPDDAAVVCITVSCGNEPAIDCADSDTIFDEGLQSCCSSAPHPADFNLNLELGAPCEPLTEVFVSVGGSATNTCDPYSVEFDHSD